MSYEIYNEDCLEGMKRIPDGTVDAVICDPPYGTTDCAWDKPLPLERFWTEIWRVSKKNAAIVIFSQMPYGAELIMSERRRYRYEWIWEKSLPVGYLNAPRMPLRCHENILVFYRRLPTYNPQFGRGKPYENRLRRRSATQIYGDQKDTVGKSDGLRYPRDVLYYSSTTGSEERLHPTQKPLPLMEYLIRTYTNECETVLDPTAGSGTTGVASIKLGRNFIGYETDKNYFLAAKVRMSSAAREVQDSLFVDMQANDY